METCPGVRSCMVEYDLRELPPSQLLELMLEAEKHLPKVRYCSAAAV